MNRTYLIAHKTIFGCLSSARISTLFLIVSVGLAFGDEENLTDPLTVNDWPQYLGPQRDAIWREEGVELEFRSVSQSSFGRHRWGVVIPDRRWPTGAFL
jgi:hypothetical protein